MKKNKVIRLTENQLVDIIRRVLTEQDPLQPNEPETETRAPQEIMKEISGITGAQIVMKNASGVNKYEEGKKQILKTDESYIIKDVWFPQIKGKTTVAFTVLPFNVNVAQGNKEVEGKTGLMKGAFKRESRDTNLPIQFRWDCNAYFEKGLGAKDTELRRYGGIKEDYINVNLAKEILKRPFCNKAPNKYKFGNITQKYFI